MKINLSVNGQQLSLNENPDEKLLWILRRQNFLSVKCGCENSSCGSCAVLLDGKCVLSCAIPIGILNGAKIVTLEFFSKQAQYQEIMKGFEKAGVSLCGYCNAGKIFAAYEIINTFSNPSREQVFERVRSLKECCVESDTLINGIIYATQIHFEKENQIKNGNK